MFYRSNIIIIFLQFNFNYIFNLIQVYSFETIHYFSFQSMTTPRVPQVSPGPVSGVAPLPDNPPNRGSPLRVSPRQIYHTYRQYDTRQAFVGVSNNKHNTYIYFTYTIYVHYIFTFYIVLFLLLCILLFIIICFRYHSNDSVGQYVSSSQSRCSFSN